MANLTVPQALEYLKNKYGIKWKRCTLYTAIKRGRLKAVCNSGKKLWIDSKLLDSYGTHRHGKKHRRTVKLYPEGHSKFNLLDEVYYYYPEGNVKNVNKGRS